MYSISRSLLQLLVLHGHMADSLVLAVGLGHTIRVTIPQGGNVEGVLRGAKALFFAKYVYLELRYIYRRTWCRIRAKKR